MRNLIVRSVSLSLAFFAAFSGSCLSVGAHPLDVSVTTLTVSGKSVSGTTYFHPSEVERILGLRGLPMRSLTYGDYYSNKEYVFDYLRAHLGAWSGISASGSLLDECSMESLETRELGVDDIFAKGFPVSYAFRCPVAFSRSLAVRNEIFVDLPLQTNRVTVYGEKGDTLGYKVLTSAISRHAFPLSGVAIVATDSDADGLADEEERAYRTDPTKADTDGDKYSDGEEVNSGWNPTNADPSPGQKYREHALDSVRNGANAGLGGQPSAGGTSFQSRFVPDTGLLDASGFGAEYFLSALKSMVAFFKEPTSGGFVWLFGLIVFLGFLHAAGPGHSKGLIVAYMVDKKRSFAEWIAFALVFTVTHLLDIALLVLVTKYLFSVYDPTPYMTMLQRAGAIALLFVSAFLAYRSVRRFRQHSIEAESTPKKAFSAPSILLGFLSGLAPCTFGWSIFLVLFSLGKMEWALPLLGALGIGIFLCLFLVVVATYFLRTWILSKSRRTVPYVEMASAFFLVVLSVVISFVLFVP